MKGSVIEISQCYLNTTPKPEDMAAILQQSFVGQGMKNVQATTREIDGTLGAIGVGEDPTFGLDTKFYEASYVLPHAEGFVYITSLYPWDEGTLRLLDSIHVEKSENYTTGKRANSTS